MLKYVHENVRNFSCEQCGKTFKAKKYLDGHVKIHHDRSSDFKCNYCGKIFGYKSNLETHIKSVHETPKPQLQGIVKCSFENCSFEASIVGMKSHVKSHKTCHTCGKGFSGQYSKRELAKHMESHSKPTVTKVESKCHICNQVFPYPSYVERHIPLCQRKANAMNAVKRLQF